MDNKTKILVMRVLKTIFYLLGFPLFVFFVLKDSNAFRSSEAYAETAAIPVKVAISIWALVSLVKAGIVVLSGKRKLATTVAAVLTFVVMLGGAFGVKTIAKKTYDKAAEAKLGDSAVASWGDQVGYYNNVTASRSSMAKELSSDVNHATGLYNIGYLGEFKKRNAEDTPIHSAADDTLIQATASNGKLIALDGKTEIGTYTTKDEVFFGTTYTHYYLDINDGYVYDAYPEGKLGFWYQYSYQSRMLKTEEEFNAYCYGGVWYGEGTYNPNGTVADGWIFSLENALDILDDYYTALEFGQKAYGSKEAFITAYKAALQNAKAAQAADNGGMKDDEYFTANDKYLANVASAEKWGVTYNRVNVILRVLFQMIEENTKLGKIQEVSTLLGLVKSMAGGTLDLDGIVTLLGSFGLTGDSLAGLIGGLGLDVDIPAGSSIKEAVECILGGFDYMLGYQSTVNKSAIDYINTGDEETDAMMKKYGFALFAGYNHGTFCGSVIVNPSEGGTIGNGAYFVSQGLDKAKVEQLKTDLSYKPTLYPMISLFRYMFAFCGLVIFSLATCFYLNVKIQKLEEEDR